MCVASPCVVDGLALASGETVDVIVHPIWNVGTTNVTICPEVAVASQQLHDALEAFDDAAALEALKCPVDFDVKPLKWGFWNETITAITFAVLEADVGLAVVQRLLEVGADPMEGESYDVTHTAWMLSCRD